MDIQTILVYLIFFACVVFTVRGFIKSLKKKSGSGCECGCSGCNKIKKNEDFHKSCPRNDISHK